MFALDSEEPFPINIDLLMKEKIYDGRNNVISKLKRNFLLLLVFVLYLNLKMLVKQFQP